jgi:site-specific DNA-methyltransferase (adenine-specific)
MRQIVRASLPLGTGVVLDPFMGGGSTIAAAVALGYESVGIESDKTFFRTAINAIPGLAALTIPESSRREFIGSTSISPTEMLSFFSS